LRDEDDTVKPEIRKNQKTRQQSEDKRRRIRRDKKSYGSAAVVSVP
jgi:hypothetical protein